MSASAITRQLESVVGSEDFLAQAQNLVMGWRQSGVASQAAIEGVLAFMENHPDEALGSPGPLVHFVEAFYGAGYEPLLLASINRKPTAQTLWMVNRLINDAGSPEERQSYIDALTMSCTHRLASDHAKREALEFLSYQAGGA